MSSGNHIQLIDTLRLTNKEWQSLSRKLDSKSYQMTGQREHERVTVNNVSQIVVAIQRPEGDWTTYAVRSRDLSSGGIGFVHGAFIHSGCACRVMLRDNQGNATCLLGHIKHCQYIEGNAHKIGVQFDEQIDIAQFVDTPRDDAAPEQKAG